LFHSKHASLKQRITVLWNHSVRVGAISHILATHHTSLKPDEAMLAGVIHDIGKLPLIAKADDNPQLADNGALLDELMNKLHCPLGKVIVQSWEFAPEIITAVAEHEDLARNSGQVDLTDVVTVANLLSYAGKEHHSKGANWAEIPAFKKLGISPEDSITILEEAREDISEIAELLGG
jgi:HD-like signal output (HDOD) protein